MALRGKRKISHLVSHLRREKCIEEEEKREEEEEEENKKRREEKNRGRAKRYGF